MNPLTYLKIARDAIKAHFEHTQIDKNALLAIYPELSAQRASFVTLTINGHLRGCIGSIIAHQILIDDLISNAVSAAFRDPRFPPLSRSELDEVKIEVSLLTHPEPITYRDTDELSRIIRPDIDGVILRLGNRQATFLPQVWEELPDFNSFFTHLGLKAGIGNDPLSYHPDIFTYQVKKYKEGSHD
ncbi:MAG: AmmeMemoRadiSam system protein A [Sulfuricurvum sp.]|uniref:AmmeMemoRadiSam system protein A n=1 Tax=Sulfuricurvum sp. TaxID=2025608 RepID=UPI00260DF201|nr:AmmeMemoRadiSam system protein A [Sulfuricurvum sp.]MDD5159952.1 AmmeMemoRadiSam system protein A [Sulfuricurvum sp.]